jgi:hypothetical protein
VTAVSPRNVWAVGGYFLHARDGHRSYQTLVLHWNGRKWTHVQSPNPGGERHPEVLYGVAADGQDDVWAVGSYGNGRGDEVPLTEHWNGHRWSVVPAPTLEGDSPEQALVDLSVVSADDVWASGSAGLMDNGFDLVSEGFAEHWDGHAWTVSPTLHEWNEGDDIDGIAAVSPDDVWAVGDWANCS